MPSSQVWIERIPVLRDNYVFVIYGDERDGGKREAVVVDPAIAPPVLAHLEAAGARLTAILNTHHHSDHVGGNADLLRAFPEAVVYAGSADQGRIPGQGVAVEAGANFSILGREVQVLAVPGHTRGHVAYYLAPVQAGEPGHVFCGDTLFAGGCGRLFEGTPAQMLASLDQLRSLPEDTQVWCAHEYTLGNLRFALTVEPDNLALQQRFTHVEAMRSRGEATIPTQIGLEKQTNPFLRWDTPSIQQAMGHTDPVRVFARLRGQKDLF